MIDTRQSSNRERAFAFVKYARAGKGDVKDVDAAYYSPQRMRHMTRMLNALLKHDTYEACTEEDYEASYLRFCDRYHAARLVNLADWQSIIGILADRIQFYTANNLPISCLAVLTLKRLWKVILALHRGE